MQFHPQEPVDTVFTEIDDLATIAEMAEAPLTQPQKINMAFLLFQKTQVFNRGLTSWISHPAEEQTWEIFKQHFRQAQLEMRQTGALTVQEAINHTQLMELVSQGVQDAILEHAGQSTTTPKIHQIFPHFLPNLFNFIIKTGHIFYTNFQVGRFKFSLKHIKVM